MKTRLLTTAALALGLCLAFTSCHKDDDDNTFEWNSVFVPADLNGKTATAVYTSSYSEGSKAQGYVNSGTKALLFYSDGTVAQTTKGSNVNLNTRQSETVEKGDWKGTYVISSGDFQNGQIQITQTHMWNSQTGGWTDVSYPETTTLYTDRKSVV